MRILLLYVRETENYSISFYILSTIVAVVWVQIMQFAEAEADCDRALKREISVKTLLRRGTARRGKHDLEGARADFKHVLSLEPKNRCAVPHMLQYLRM